jgi:hypothetical protein
MGIFHEMVEVVNRTSEQLEVIFDGQRTYLAPNYDAAGEPVENVRNMLPRQVVPYALNQNVIMGSEEAMDPSKFESYVGVIERKPGQKKHSWHNCAFVSRNTNPEVTRVSEEQINEELIGDARFKTARGGRKHKATDAALGVSTAPFDLQSR